MRICKGCIVAYVLKVEYELDTKNTNLPKRKSKIYASILTFRSGELTVTNLIVNNTILYIIQVQESFYILVLTTVNICNLCSSKSSSIGQ